MEQLRKIVGQRLRATPKPGVHPDPDLLNAFAEKSLTDRERSEVLQHLGACADCREVLSLAMPEAVSQPSPVAQTSRWLGWPTLRWGALAACVVVVGAALTLRHERRPFENIPVAEEAAPAPATSGLENQKTEQPKEKITAKTSPDSPSASDRDSAVARKFAQQNSVTADSRTRVAESRGTAILQDKKFQETPNKSLPNFDAISKNPAPQSPPPAAKEAESVPQAKARSESPQAATQTVTVEAAATAVQTSPPNFKDETNKNEAREQVQVTSGQAGAMSPAVRKADALPAAMTRTAAGDYAKRSRSVQPLPRWTISGDGGLQRSFDSGKNWQTIQVANNVSLRALAANDSDVWVGGAAGTLYHSSDAGQHWAQVTPVAEGTSLAADIVAVEFSDLQHGKLTTANREIWTTSDAGKTWQRH